jgi:hypothetical protein
MNQLLSNQLIQNKNNPVIINKQKHFYGNERDQENVMFWLNSIDINMTYCKVPAHKTVECASVHLNSTALLAFRDWQEVSWPNVHTCWKSFCEMMKNRFFPLENLVILRNKLLRIKQTSTVANYNKAFV